jgi:hypothetical protein
VLRQARQAIEADRPLRMFGMPRWAAPVAIAATLVLGLSVVFKTAMPLKDRVPEVTVQPVAQRLDYPQPASLPPPPTAPAQQGDSASGAIVVELGAPASAGPPLIASDSREMTRAGSQTQAASAAAAAAPAWRQDARAWQAEIERLRARGDTVRADAEQAEYNRQYRALAVSPDR